LPLTKNIGGCKISLQKGDLSALEVESFVFYAQDNLKLGSGFGNAIAMRGGISIQKELEVIGHLPPTEAVVTKAGALKAKYIIHANGPKFQEVDGESKLCATVLNALRRAEESNISQIAFPLMGTGFYGIPLAVSAKVMMEAFQQHLQNGGKIKEIIVCAMDNREYKPFEEALGKI